ncbi:putative polyketide synthase protein [Eutypa lata UCREL1]|uniref:Putative polyketide synthase protein n=1 Tax=Eutypa lata (strain UCR-EL1) TaxID=1287681 RepID=M7SYP5_EUTLA|nr:putative polyketide synthase protein [Eutypa lata UCREL1]
MASWLKGISNGLSNAVTSTHKMENVSAIPAGVTRAAAVALLQDHEFFLRCDPHYASHTIAAPHAAAGTPAKAKEHYKLPPGVEPLGAPAVKCYEVVDVVENPFFASNVKSEVEVADFEAGIFVRIRSKGGVVFDTIWSIRAKGGEKEKKKDKDGGQEGEEEGELELVQDATISAAAPILSVVKGQVEKNRGGIHKKIITRLVEDRDKAKGGPAAAAAPAVAVAEEKATPTDTAAAPATAATAAA